MNFENTQVMNFEGAIRGMRNPMNSWGKSDSFFGFLKSNLEDNLIRQKIAKSYINWKEQNLGFEDIYDGETYMQALEEEKEWLLKNGILQSIKYGKILQVAYLGANDLHLMQKLIEGGSEHRKFLRQIIVSVDINAPLFWWKEFDTYKIGTTENSTSTMHKLAETPITLDCFEKNGYDEKIFYDDSDNQSEEPFYCAKKYTNYIIEHLETLRKAYNSTKDIKYWKELIRWLPESWLQKRTVTMNYENILNICRQRKNHKLIEWRYFIEWAETLPYANEIIFY